MKDKIPLDLERKAAGIVIFDRGKGPKPLRSEEQAAQGVVNSAKSFIANLEID